MYFVLLQPNMLIGGRKCAVEYFKAGRSVQKSDEHCCETAAVFVIVI